MGLTMLAAKCRACPRVDKCDHKRMEEHGLLPHPPLAESASMAGASSAAQPVLREEVEIRVNGLPQVSYKDEIEKELTKALYAPLYAYLGLQYGA